MSSFKEQPCFLEKYVHFCIQLFYNWKFVCANAGSGAWEQITKMRCKPYKKMQVCGSSWHYDIKLLFHLRNRKDNYHCVTMSKVQKSTILRQTKIVGACCNSEHLSKIPLLHNSSFSSYVLQTF